MTNTQLPKEVQEEIRKQAADHVQAHYGSFVYPSALEDLFTDGASIYALKLQSLQAENLRLREALEKSAGVWVKASERLPDKVASYWCQIPDADGGKCELIFKPGGFFITLLGARPLPENILWLDESALTETITSKTE